MSPAAEQFYRPWTGSSVEWIEVRRGKGTDFSEIKTLLLSVLGKPAAVGSYTCGTFRTVQD